MKIRSLRPAPGTSDRGVIGVADPNFSPEYRPKGIRMASAIHPATAPTLLSHFPTLSPTTLSQQETARPTIETAMKYVLLVESFCASGPPMNSAFAAMKYSRPGR